MTEVPAAGASLRIARQARGFSQQQLASMAGVSRQAVSAVESGHSDPSLRVALALAQALGMSVEGLFGPGEPAAPVTATSVAPLPPATAGPGFTQRVTLAAVGERFVALPLHADNGAGPGFLPAGGLALPQLSPPAQLSPQTQQNQAPPRPSVAVRPLGPPRSTLVVSGCDPALPLLATPLSLLDPPVAFAWWPCGSAESLHLASEGLVHAAGVHTQSDNSKNGRSRPPQPLDAARAGEPALPAAAEVVGFTAWREGLVFRQALEGIVTGLDAVVRHRLRLVNREPGAEARRLLDREAARLGIAPQDLAGYETSAAGHLQVASAVAAGLADVGVASEPAARAYGLAFHPLASESFSLVIPAQHAASREVQALLRVLSSPWLLAQLASLPGYDATTCGTRQR
jgi:molybdate-binding protein/transcriptional regulator with XRE-family HTH domain